MDTLNTSMTKLFEALLDESAKTDFIDKFGQQRLDNFDKARQRLKNANMSVDYGQYLKMTPEELDALILSLYDDKKDLQKKRILQGTDKEIRGEYEYLGEKNGYKVYQPLDYLSSMDLGVNTGWCTTGRYGHYGHPEYTPSEADAKEHWNNYVENDNLNFYYFLDAKTMYGKYAIVVYPETVTINKTIETSDKRYYLKSANYEIYNERDDLDYAAAKNLPLDLIPKKLEVDAYSYNKNGLIIDGTVVKKAAVDVVNVTIPEGITEIGPEAFSDCAWLKTVSLPESVTTIGQAAFMACISLTSINMPDSITTIGARAFKRCYSLRPFRIPNKVTAIRSETFAECDGITSLIIPDTVKRIDESAFVNCSKLERIHLPVGLTIISDHLFAGCISLEQVNIPNSVIRIGSYAFEDCMSLTSISLPKNLQVIRAAAFAGCKNLESIVIPKTVDTILDTAFRNCDKLESIVIPGRVETIPKYAFFWCKNLSYVVIEEGVAVIDDQAFAHCGNLKAITIPNSVNYLSKIALLKTPKDLIIYTNNDYVKDICSLSDNINVKPKPENI